MELLVFVCVLMKLVAGVRSMLPYSPSVHSFGDVSGFNYGREGFPVGYLQNSGIVGPHGFPNVGFQNNAHQGPLDATFVGTLNYTEPCLNETLGGHIPQQNIYLGSHGIPPFNSAPFVPYPAYFNHLPPALTSTYHYQYVPQLQILHPQPAPLPYPTYKPFVFPTFAPLPTLKPFIFPTSAPLLDLGSRKSSASPPIQHLAVRLPTFPPMKVLDLPTPAPPRYGYVTFPTLPPLKFLVPPTPAPLTFKEIPLPPLRVPVFPTFEPVKWMDVAAPTLPPFPVPVWPTFKPDLPLKVEQPKFEDITLEDFHNKFFGRATVKKSELVSPVVPRYKCKNKTSTAIVPKIDLVVFTPDNTTLTPLDGTTAHPTTPSELLLASWDQNQERDLSVGDDFTTSNQTTPDNTTDVDGDSFTFWPQLFRLELETTSGPSQDGTSVTDRVNPTDAV